MVDASPTDPSLQLGAVHLAVADLPRSVDFYTRVLGLQLVTQGEEEAILAAHPRGRALVQLTRLHEPTPVPPRATGLFHVALLYSSRPGLGAAVLRAARAGWPITGASDHGVSEAVYLDDPDGLGIEIYADRPRAQWAPGPGGSGVTMYTRALDLPELVSQAPDPLPPHAATDTRVGHVHLKVADVGRAVAVYADGLGLGLQAVMPSAAFLGAGGYHHHIGVNTWQSLGAPAAPATAPGLRLIELEVHQDDALEQLERRLQDAGTPGVHRSDERLTLRDADGQALIVSRVERERERAAA